MKVNLFDSTWPGLDRYRLMVCNYSVQTSQLQNPHQFSVNAMGFTIFSTPSIHSAVPYIADLTLSLNESLKFLPSRKLPFSKVLSTGCQRAKTSLYPLRCSTPHETLSPDRQ